MKKMMFVAMMMAMTITAHAMSYSAARNEALFLSDKMAYELNLTEAQYEAVYEINLDYMMSVSGRNDVFGTSWSRRNSDLQYVLTVHQYNQYVGLSYFYRPLNWKHGNWTFSIYNHYTDKQHFYKARPKTYASYKGKGHDQHIDAQPSHHGSTRGNPATQQSSPRPNKKDYRLAQQGSSRGNSSRGSQTGHSRGR
ncbi:MAG: hypothetical protein IJQ59_02280 [Bacteroidaceae bacterium]|nr:hypothetical protein [Bacteroidaceae bacterium]